MHRVLPCVLIATGVTTLLGADSQVEGVSTAESRLRAMPLERRLALSEKLRQFDGLDREEQQRIRELDRRLNDLPTSDRSNIHAVLRRYHLWMRTLTEEQRREVNAAPPGSRMAVVSRLVAETTPATAPATPFLVRLAEFGGASPFDLAGRVRVWLALTPAEQAEINRLAEPVRTRRLQELASKHKVAPVPRPNQSDDEILDRATRLAPFGGFRRGEDFARLVPKQKQKLAEHAYFLDHPPARVTADNLLRFAAALPFWIRSNFDALPPDEARRRLTILYRLVFPSPAEFKAPAPPAAAAPKAEPPNAPSPPTNPTPF